MSPVTAIKVYGERNTGTNYVSALIAQNFDVVMFGSGSGISSTGRIFLQLLGIISLRGRYVFLERFRDYSTRKNFYRNLGWKHTRVNVEKVLAQQKDNVGFIALVKHPYSWALSLFKNPYHYDKGIPTTFGSFLTTPYRMHERDAVGTAWLKPIEIWNQKVGSYFELKGAVQPVCICRYEDFLRDESATVSKLAAAMSLENPENIKTVTKSTKDAAKTYDDYRDYYLSETWRDQIGETDYETMNAQLDHALVKQCGYTL